MQPTGMSVAAVALVASVALLFVPIVVSNLLLDKLVYMEKLDGESYEGFVNSIQHLSVVYFFKLENPIMSNFLKEVEKSAAIMTIYETKFGIVDCSTHPGVGHCRDKDSEEQVYMYGNGHMILSVSVHSMFSVDSIISNVLQVVLLHEAPIIQAVEEKDKFISENRGVSDVVFSYQKALGTYNHRILMEAIFVYQHSYHFAVSNEQKTVEDLPFYSPADLSGIWLFRCKSVRSDDQLCPVYKFRGTMERATLSKFFRALELPTLVHGAGKDRDFDPYQESEVDSLYIFYDEREESAATAMIKEFELSYFGLMGIISVNVNAVDVANYTFERSRSLPLLAFRNANAVDLVYMDESETPSGFLERMLNFAKISEVRNQLSDLERHDLQDEHEIEMEKQDDVVAKVAFELRGVLFDRTHLPTLTDKSFYPEVNDRPLLMVLFYLDFDARNQIAVRLFARAAEVLAEDRQFPLATVECFDWTDVCGRVNISIYPTVRIYRSNMEPVLYDGPLSVEAFVTAAKLHMLDAPIDLTTAEEVSLFAGGDFPGKIKMHTDVAVVGAFGNDQLKYEKTFKMAARHFQGRHLCGIVRDDIAESTCKSRGLKAPCIFVLKHHDQLEPVGTVKLEESLEKLIANIELAVLPLLPELTAENFPAYFAMKKPFVILFTSDIDGVYFHAISKLASEGQTQDIILAWMNISSLSGNPSLGEQILHHHVKEPNHDEILVINHETAQVHRLSDSEISKESVSIWLNGVIRGDIKTTVRLSEEEWKPRLPAFDFLKKMDRDAARSEHDNRIPQYMRDINEDGLDTQVGTDEERLMYNMMENELGQSLEDEIQMELEQLKYSRLYQKSYKKPAHKPKPESPDEDKAKQTTTMMHSEL